MELEKAILKRVQDWADLSRWEKSELGRDLRRQGLSYGEIMDLIDVKKSTLATWCRDVTLTERQVTDIKIRRAQLPGIPRDTQWKRREEIQIIQARARARARELDHDPIWIAGVVLYWAEGGKSRNRFELSNSDPLALRLFIRWVRDYLDADAEFVLQLHLHEGNNDDDAQLFWSTVLDLKDAHFYKTFIKPAGTGHRKNLLLHGVCRVNVRRCSDMWQTAMTWVDHVATSLGVERTL